MEVVVQEVGGVELITDVGVGPPGPFGPPGPPGPPGPSGAAASSYQHDQASPVDTWIINHNLGFRPCAIPYSVGGMMMWANVQHFSDNQVRIYFDGPVSGYAVCS